MCGICGIIRPFADAPPIDRNELFRTRDAMHPRGPDGEGAWFSACGTAALGHRRLAVIDLSAGGAQPMTSDDGRFTLVFNGEIYNYRELRHILELEARRFRTRSDTEVILQLLSTQGVGGLVRARGMYALAAWDAVERILWLARDPYGIKPLYYAWDGRTLRFASQVRALEAGGAVPTAEDPVGVAAFLLWGSVPEPTTLRKGIRAVPAGHVVRVRPESAPEVRPLLRLGVDEPQGEPEHTDALEAVRASVHAHLVSDVPVGVFLSAGIDSALVAALASEAIGSELTTFTLVFDEYSDTSADEGPLARRVSAALGTRHIERRVRRDEATDLWPQVIAAMDQPSIDGFNTYLVSRLAHEAGLKVALSGLGGDELFGSYPSFRQLPSWARWGRMAAVMPRLADAVVKAAGSITHTRPKIRGWRLARDIPGAYLLRRGLFLPDEVARMVGAEAAAEALSGFAREVRGSGVRSGDDWRQVHLLESTQYMRNQLLRDADWASMAHSLELRVPLVDVRLRAALDALGFEPARSEGKAALLRRATRNLPAELFHRRKTGFTTPVARWLDLARAGDPPGLASRRLALRVLREFGVAVDATRLVDTA